ncbi:caspase family protein [Microbulbifer sp. CAU 1566]|uniref:C13 family peptidase n=1 Tax=Microbulbifer sp. CAU 1566 TaxID=2933269 RepID=UPI002003D8B7|nr:C13 family peptidase [Microbulbifer sp. CAU 1566]MCK7598169.1 caspase family protein [Microbulbifer sp. CAU 1566]
MKRPLSIAAGIALPALALLLAACKAAQFGGDTALPDGSVYRGEFQDGLFHGEGELQWPDGRHYLGGFEHGMLGGHGKFTYADGCVYEGEFANGDFHGNGRYACDETSWEGNFQQGNLARGTITWEGFGRYTGELQDYQPHGEGALTYAEGVTIRAHFENGQANGEGVRSFTTADGELREDPGFFVNDQYYASEAAWQRGETESQSALESRLYSEGERLQSALSQLARQRPGVRDVYTLIVGGDGTQGVFEREVNWVAERLGTTLDMERRQIRLSNGSDTLPLATRTSVRKSLQALDAVMDAEEDLLLVHFVSHGDANGSLYLADVGLPLNDLSVADGKQWLDALKAQHQWVIVSACYSGHWQQALANPNRTVFTSAAKDRTSFGCSNDSERTWFSAALYGEALGVGVDDPAAWFAAANRRVTEMEKDQGIEENAHSLPQVAIGNAFLAWWQTPANARH